MTNKPAKYYARHRRAITMDGVEVQVLTTRYAYGIMTRAGVDHMKPAYYDHASGVWYAMAKTATPDKYRTDGDTYARLVPIAYARLWDAYPTDSDAKGIPPVSVIVRNGRAEALEDSYGRYDVTEAAAWAGAADVLQLSKPARKSPRSA